MSVFTAVGHDDLAAWLAPLGVGTLTGHAGIAAGLQNSNYFVDTTRGRYVLTVFESLPAAALDFYLALQSHLATAGLPCPQPLADPAGRHWRPLCGKPAALFTCLPGEAAEQPSAAQCRTVGEALARLHLAARPLTDVPPHACGADWCAATGHALLPVVHVHEAALLADELAFQAGQLRAGLPQGVIHADLFRDNVLWSADGRLSGLLDFYFAGQDAWLFDLAVAANDWCSNETALAALLAGYATGRPLTPAEVAAWPGMRRAAALRFWLLRLERRQVPRAGTLVTVKDPAHFERLLQQLRLAPAAFPG